MSRQLNTPSGSSSSSFYSRSTPRSRTRSAAASLILEANRRSGTPSRPPLSRQAHNFYGPGVRLEDVERVDTVQDHSASEVDCTSDFEFGISRPRSRREKYIEQALSESQDRDLSPEIPVCDSARVYGYAATGSQNEVIPMLQQQQLILQRVLESQKTLEERQNNIEEKLANLQAQVNVPVPTVSPTASSSDGKRKRLVTRTLSVSIA